MLIKRQPNLKWFVNFLAILLLSILITNNLICSIYINSLKEKLTDVTETYFFAQAKLQGSLEALIETRIELQKLKYSLVQTSGVANNYKNTLLMEFRKNEISFYYRVLSLKKSLSSKYMEALVKKIYDESDNYMNNTESIILNDKNESPAELLKRIDESETKYLSIKKRFEVLSESIQTKVLGVKNSELLNYKILPLIFGVSFLAALLIGGWLISMARREVKNSVIDNVSAVLSEAYQNQKDCIQTLQLVSESLKNEKSNPFWQYFDNRRDLHAQEMENLEKILNDFKKLN